MTPASRATTEHGPSDAPAPAVLRPHAEVAFAEELAALYSGYRRALDATGRIDDDLRLAAAVDALREDPGRWAARPVFVSAALYEPFGLAVLEAAAAGCALVLSDIPTFRELWDGAALFVAPDEAAIADAIAALVADPARRAALGEAARARAARYTPDATAAAMAALHARLLPHRRAAA